MSARKRQPAAITKPTPQKQEPQTTRQFLLRPAISAVALLGVGGLVWWLLNSIGHSMTNDNIRGIARTVKSEGCLNYSTWTDAACPNKQPGDYVPFWDTLGLIVFAIAVVLAIYIFGYALYKWIMAAPEKA